MSTSEQTQPPATNLDSRLGFETLIAELSLRFINLSPGEVDREIEESLRQVCEFLGIDFAVLWQVSGAPSAPLTATHAFSADRGQSARLEALRQDQYPWFVQQMLAGRMVAISSLEELPAEAAVDRDSARGAGIKSNLTLPLSAGGEPLVGVLGFNTLWAERGWPDAVVNRLQLVAQVFTHALVRKRHDLLLRESEERLALAADSAEAGLWTLAFATGVFWVTPRARAIFGYLPDEAISVGRLMESVHPDDRGLVRGVIDRCRHDHERFSVEYRILLGDGRVRWIASSGRSLFPRSGEAERMTGVSIDITERKQAESVLRRSQARQTAGADLARLGYYEVDFAEGVTYVDERFREICGVPPERERGLQPVEFWMECLHPDDRRRVLEDREKLHDGRLERLSVEYRFLHPALGERWMQHLARVAERDTAGQAVKSFGVLRDITESRRAEEELHTLGRRLIRAHEEERELLARELHDDVTQRLAVLAIDLGRAEIAAPDGAPADAMRAAREGLVRLSEDIHSLAYQLHPSVLDELGLVEAIRTECERRGREGRANLSIEAGPLPAAIGRDTALCLYRVVQEALNNVIRHAGPCAVSVVLRQMDGGLLLAVRDDGVGFDPGTPKQGRSLGLASMRERVRLVNGTLDIESTPGRGTEIIAWVPADGGAG